MHQPDNLRIKKFTLKLQEICENLKSKFKIARNFCKFKVDKEGWDEGVYQNEDFFIRNRLSEMDKNCVKPFLIL